MVSNVMILKDFSDLPRIKLLEWPVNKGISYYFLFGVGIAQYA
jgi:hypothetical protein